VVNGLVKPAHLFYTDSEMKYDVIIVGGGPAGVFAALGLLPSGLEVLVLEKGKDIRDRHCPSLEKGKGCISCSPCDLVSGLGGAGAFSDGKLTLSPQVGGRLKELIGEAKTQELIHYVDSLFLQFGASKEIYGVSDEIEKWSRKASLAELKLIPVPIRHIGTECARTLIREMKQKVSSSAEIALGTAATEIRVEDGKVVGVKTNDGRQIDSDYLILAPGREGADWLVRESNRLGLTLYSNPIDVGLRVELPAEVMSQITDLLYECKLEFYSRKFDDRVRTFCMCPYGEVTMESTGGEDPVITVNGHSYAYRRTDNTNFALLVSTTFTQPFKEPIAYGKYLARLANILSGGVLVQRLGDLQDGRRSTLERIERGIIQPSLSSAVPGDLSFVLPYRHLHDVIEMLQAMDEFIPGIASRHTLLYGVEVKFYSSRVKLTENLETEVSNMFAVGDGAGVSRGLIQASASGIVAAQEIIRRTK
jgi:hypothetical protein